MTGSRTESTPLARLVLFMICLSIAGAFVGGAHYYAVDLPQQKAVAGHPPANANSDIAEKCNTCRSYCNYLPNDEKYKCLSDCELICA